MSLGVFKCFLQSHAIAHQVDEEIAHQTFGPCRYRAALSMLLGVGVGDGMTGSCNETTPTYKCLNVS